jgi:hypothetical protein
MSISNAKKIYGGCSKGICILIKITNALAVCFVLALNCYVLAAKNIF